MQRGWGRDESGMQCGGWGGQACSVCRPSTLTANARCLKNAPMLATLPGTSEGHIKAYAKWRLGSVPKGDLEAGRGET